MREISPRTDGNWSLILPAGAGPILYQSSPDAQNSLPQGISFARLDEAGYGLYRLNN
jgi:hypothetical protein